MNTMNNHKSRNYITQREWTNSYKDQTTKTDARRDHLNRFITTKEIKLKK